MAGVNSVLRVVGAFMSLVVIIYVSWVGVSLYEPIHKNIGGTPSGLGWPDVDFLFFMGLGLIGLVFTVFIWLWVAPVRNDVRQETRPPGGPF